MRVSVSKVVAIRSCDLGVLGVLVALIKYLGSYAAYQYSRSCSRSISLAKLSAIFLSYPIASQAQPADLEVWRH